MWNAVLVQTDGESIALFTDRDTATAQIVVAAFAFVSDENRIAGGLCAARRVRCSALHAGTFLCFCRRNVRTAPASNKGWALKISNAK
ncbi:hypothetical protein Y032_0021g339 [Ancylostoma ceylanicum]|uniref:Uncharacterized protein n=1 Tax=Ancylostoma ceylanicum TaxID=53326 RepID=A0A016V1P9_9BILA|nr:hypothetical protein Y032_0021g339 [Ancylostoma ceylanicum]